MSLVDTDEEDGDENDQSLNDDQSLMLLEDTDEEDDNHQNVHTNSEDGSSTIDLICYECETDDLPSELLRRMRLIEPNAHGPVHQYTVMPLEHCNNCMRSQRVRTRYRLCSRSKKSGSRFELSMVKSSDIRRTPSPLRHVASHRTYSGFYYLLCKECKVFLTRTSSKMDSKERRAIDEKRNSWDYIWPSYYWNLIKDCKLSPEKCWNAFHKARGCRGYL